MNVFSSDASRWVCALLTACIAGMSWRSPTPGRRRSLLLWLLVGAGLVNVLLLTPKRVNHSNLGHYYIGAKYACGYFDFYSVIRAARGEPQEDYRDLHDLRRMVRSDPQAKRLYYLELLERAGLFYPPDATTASLRGMCLGHGLVAAEAASILNAKFGAASVAGLREDLAILDVDVDDLGFNGSPLSVWIRQLDPSLHRPAGPAAYWINLAFQIGALFLMAALCERFAGWRRGDGLLIVSLMLANWDYVGWSLNGLMTAGWMLPVVLAAWAGSQRRTMLCAVSIAWAGLVKVYPYILVLPFLVAASRRMLRRIVGSCDRGGPSVREVAVMLAAAAGASAILAVVGRTPGYAWTEFAEKILTQFTQGEFTGNGAGLSHLYLALEVRQADFAVFTQLTWLFALGWMLWTQPRETWWEDFPMKSLILMAGMAWLSQKWLNYYTIIGLLLIPAILHRHRGQGVLLLLLYSLSMALPEFTRTYRGPAAILALVKVMPHLAIPIVGLAHEIQRAGRFRGAVEDGDRLERFLHRHGPRCMLVAVVVSVLGICADVTRHHLTAAHFAAGKAAMDSGNPADGERHFDKVVRLQPRSARAHFNLGFLCAERGDTEAALRQYETAIRLEPGHVDTRLNLGILLMQLGRTEAATREFEACVRLQPYNAAAQYNLALAQLGEGKRDDALRHLEMARRLAPAMTAAQALHDAVMP